jgi:PAS domain S-box-containing protein
MQESLPIGPSFVRQSFHRAADHAPVMMWMSDAQARPVWTNKGWRAFTGMSGPIGTEKEWDLLIHPDDRQRWEKVRRAAWKDRAPFMVDHRLRHRDGVFRWVLESGAPIMEEGIFHGFMDSCVDIHEGKERVEHLRLITQVGKLGGWNWDIVNNSISWTDAVYGVHGMEKSDAGMTLESYTQLIHPDDRERVRAAIEVSLREAAPYEIEFRVKNPEGRTGWVFTNGVVMREQGRPVRMLGSTMDITRRKAAETQLLHAKDELKAQVEGLGRLHDLALQLAPVPDMGQALTTILHTLMELHHADRGMVTRKDRATGRFMPIGHFGFPMELHGEIITLQGGVCGKVASMGTRVVVEDAEHDADLAKAARTFGFRSVHGTPVLDHAGGVIGVISLMFDTPGRPPSELEVQLAELCARHAAEVMYREEQQEELQARDERFNRFMDHLPGHAWIKDAQGRYVFVSGGVPEEYGTPLPRILGHTDTEIFSAEMAARHLQSDAQVRATESTVETVDSVEHEDGTRHSLVSKFLLPDAAGGPADLAGIAIDITEQRRAQLEAHESEGRFRVLAETMPQLIWISDSEGRVVWFNQRFYDYSGLTEEAARADGGLSLLHPDHLQRVMVSRRKAHELGESWEETFPLRGRDGLYRWFLMRAIPVRNERGAITRWFGTNTDITDERDAQEKLKEADRRKDEFLATLAHELRNPLAPLRHALMLLEEEHTESATMRSAVELMDRQLGHMVRLIDDLMDVSRISHGNIQLRLEHMDLREAVRLALEAVGPEAEQHGHHIQAKLPDAPVPLKGDLVRLTQVVANLLHNAVKYTPDGGTVQVELVVEGAVAVLCIIDDGMGIPAAMLPHVFDMFTQVDRTLERSKGGLGIGLNIVKRLVGMHQGTVEVHSAGTDQGCTFTVRLPVATEGVPKGTPVQKPQVKRVRKVLVVDDNRDAADSLALVIKAKGHQVRAVYNGAAALEEAASFLPDLVFMDLGMPGMDGYATCASLRGTPHGKHIRIIALSGWGQGSDRQRSREVGFDLHLVKPADMQVLMQVLDAP